MYCTSIQGALERQGEVDVQAGCEGAEQMRKEKKRGTTQGGGGRKSAALTE